MTRWFVIHSTLDVTLARNVGYKSIGHGFYLEDATETDIITAAQRAHTSRSSLNA